MRRAGLVAWLDQLRPRARGLRARRDRLGIEGIWAWRLGLGLAVVAALTYLSPHQRPQRVPVLRVGARAAETISAPFLVYVYKGEDELAAERLEAARSVPASFAVRPALADSQLARLDSVLGVLTRISRLEVPDSLKRRHLLRQLPQITGTMSADAVAQVLRALEPPAALAPHAPDFRSACRQLLTDLYDTGIVASKAMLAGGGRRARLVDGAGEIDLEALHSVEELRQGRLLALARVHPALADRGAAGAAYELLSLFIEPNLLPRPEETHRLQDAARRAVAPVKRVLSPDEPIIEKGATVTAEHIEALQAYADELARQELASPIRRVLLAAAAATMAAFMVLFLGLHLTTREPEIAARPGHMLLLALFVTGTAAIAAYLRGNGFSPYLTPTPLTAMLATILFSPQVAVVLAVVLALYVGSVFGDLYVGMVCLLAATVAVHSVRRVRHRNQFYRAILLVPLSYTALIAASDLVRFVPVGREMLGDITPAVFTAVMAPILTIGLLPIFESLFHITTDITLLELSDLNRPLLRELAIRAPGTYTHSLIMANLSESAAEAIGANPLHARVGCYYHDIGKILKPEYFTENQGLGGGRNPHDRLTPNMSMLIIAAHVKDGLELAAEHGLPQGIADLIPQHHGTTVIEYFYNRAVELGGRSVRRDDFRYDGPRPQTKEAGILMLADSVESAARTLTERTPNRVRQLVRNIVQQKFTAGELDECALTLQDLHRIEDSFVPVLMGTLHGRVEYPWQRTAARRGLAAAGARGA